MLFGFHDRCRLSRFPFLAVHQTLSNQSFRKKRTPSAGTKEVSEQQDDEIAAMRNFICVRPFQKFYGAILHLPYAAVKNFYAFLCSVFRGSRLQRYMAAKNSSVTAEQSARTAAGEKRSSIISFRQWQQYKTTSRFSNPIRCRVSSLADRAARMSGIFPASCSSFL